MTRPLSALLLLAAFGLSLLLGPHPCGAWHAGRGSAKASCHESEPSPTGPQLSADTHEEGGDGCSTFCQHACHMTAIAEARPVAFAISLLSEATVEPSGHGLPLFAHPIDHIPLA
jgi:hypothetical protein